MKYLIPISILILCCCQPSQEDNYNYPKFSKFTFEYSINEDLTSELERTATTNAIGQINSHLGCDKLYLIHSRLIDTDLRLKGKFINTIAFKESLDGIVTKEHKNPLGVASIWAEKDQIQSDILILRKTPAPGVTMSISMVERYGTVLVHEIGHSMGLQHNEDDNNNLMYPYIYSYKSGFSLFPEYVWAKFVLDLNNRGVVCE